MRDLVALLRYTYLQSSQLFILALVISLLAQAAFMLHPLLLGKVVDLISAQQFAAVRDYLALYVIATVVLVVLFPGLTVVHQVSERARKNLVIQWHERFFARDYNELSQKKSGEILEIFDRADDYTGHMINTTMAEHIPRLIKMILILGYLIIMDIPLIFAALMISSVGLVGVSRWFAAMLRPIMDRTNALHENTMGKLGDILGCGSTIKQMGSQDTALVSFTHTLRQYFRLQSKEAIWEFASFSSSQLMVWLTQALILLLGLKVLESPALTTLTPGQILACYLYSSMFLSALLSLTQVFYDITAWRADKAPLDQLIQLSARPQNTHFELADQATLVLMPFALRCPTQLELKQQVVLPFASKTLITGGSGVGKSVLAHIISGIQRRADTIYWDGSDTSLWSLSDLSQIFYYSSPDLLTLKGNFCEAVFYRLTANMSPEQWQRATQLLMDFHLEHFIDDLHQSTSPFSTHGLSYGEKKRLALCRALFLQRPVTIIEHPTEGVHQGLVEPLWDQIMDGLKDSTLICFNQDAVRSQDFDYRFAITPPGYQLQSVAKEE